MTILKNRLFIGALCVILAVFIGFFAVPLLMSVTNQKVEVLVAGVDIAKGTQITEDMLVTAERFSSDLPAGAGLVRADVVGRYATTDITRNDLIFQGKFSNEYPYPDESLHKLPVGKFAVAVSTSSLSSSVAGKIRPGDIVTVFVNTTKETGDLDLSASYYPELMYMKVLSVTTDEGLDIGEETALPETGLADSPVPGVVTLLCNLEQARMLAGFESHAQIHLALTSRESSGLADSYLARQDEYFEYRNAERERLAEEAAQREQEELERQRLEAEASENDEGEESEEEPPVSTWRPPVTPAPQPEPASEPSFFDFM